MSDGGAGALVEAVSLLARTRAGRVILVVMTAYLTVQYVVSQLSRAALIGIGVVIVALIGIFACADLRDRALNGVLVISANANRSLFVVALGVGAVAWFSGCGPDVQTSTGGEGGSTQTTTTLSTGAGTGSGYDCGGAVGAPCGQSEYCAYEEGNECGKGLGKGVCQPRPDACPGDCIGICGCDGKLYCNACSARAVGIDVDPAASCPPPTDCAALAEALAIEAISGDGCTTVVRIEHESMALLGYRVLCGPYTDIDEAAARVVAQTDSGFGAEGVGLSAPQAVDEFVFWLDPGDFGGAAAVSKRTGQTVFGGGIVWDGKGEITYPVAWKSKSALGEGCAPPEPPPQAHGFDLRDGSALPASDVDAALSVVWTTALPAALAMKGGILDAVVLLYPRTVGAFDPSVAEWVVLVNSGAPK